MQLEKTGKIKINNIKFRLNKIVIEYLNVDNEENKIKLPLEISSYYDLNKYEEISLDKWNEILFKSKEIEIEKYLINLYSSKTISIYETKKKAMKYYSNDEKLLDKCILELKNNSFLDDRKFVNEYYEYLSNSLYGKYYILNFFKNNEIDKELLKDLDFNEEKEKEKAVKYLGKLLNSQKNNFMKIKVKIYNSLLKRGFDQNLTYEIINSLNIDENKERELLQKDLKRLIEKELKRKDEIDYQVINKKLISKGYRFKDIKEEMDKYKGENHD